MKNQFLQGARAEGRCKNAKYQTEQTSGARTRVRTQPHNHTTIDARRASSGTKGGEGAIKRLPARAQLLHNCGRARGNMRAA
jgi:hypothetical protein